MGRIGWMSARARQRVAKVGPTPFNFAPTVQRHTSLATTPREMQLTTTHSSVPARETNRAGAPRSLSEARRRVHGRRSLAKRRARLVSSTRRADRERATAPPIGHGANPGDRKRCGSAVGAPAADTASTAGMQALWAAGARCVALRTAHAEKPKRCFRGKPRKRLAPKATLGNDLGVTSFGRRRSHQHSCPWLRAAGAPR